ncbi:hypothetical protein HN51_037298 [Arachis hypogaea]
MNLKQNELRETEPVGVQIQYEDRTEIANTHHQEEGQGSGDLFCRRSKAGDMLLVELGEGVGNGEHDDIVLDRSRTECPFKVKQPPKTRNQPAVSTMCPNVMPINHPQAKLSRSYLSRDCLREAQFLAHCVATVSHAALHLSRGRHSRGRKNRVPELILVAALFVVTVRTHTDAFDVVLLAV